VKALEIMIKSFLAPKQILHYSLQKIVDLLLFESASECASFLRAHGVESEVDDDVGAPLPQNPYLTYTPHSSFDAQGYLKPESYEAKDQVINTQGLIVYTSL